MSKRFFNLETGRRVSPIFKFPAETDFLVYLLLETRWERTIEVEMRDRIFFNRFFRVPAKTGIVSLTWDPCWDKLKKKLAFLKMALCYCKTILSERAICWDRVIANHCNFAKLRLKPIPAVPLSSRVGLQSLGNSSSILLKLSNWCLCFQQLI